MKAAGISDSDFGAVDYILDHESGWEANKYNYSCSQKMIDSDNCAYGLGQALPASKMARFGSDYMTNPVTQLQWANSYAIGKFGSWSAAYDYWIAHRNW